MSLTSQDKELIWHPYTQHATSQECIPIAKGEGAWLVKEDGSQLLDLVSSWWVNIHGHANIEIAEAIKAQALELEHVIFGGFTHRPAVELCSNLRRYLPANLNKFFFSDNGSTAVEVALKMAYQCHRNRGDKKRTKFIAFEGGYHGDTFGAMAVGKASGFFPHFSDLTFSVEFAPFPSAWIGKSDVLQEEERCFKRFAEILAVSGGEVAAIIVEPLVQGSAGMRMCSPAFMKRVVTLAKEYGVLVIFDEVMTGFYRAGSMFALDQLNGATPDILCVAKGLTGGFLPLALTIASEQVYEAFLGDSIASALMHGHSYTANPLGCAAAIQSLKMLEREEVQNQLASLVELQKIWAQKIAANPKYQNVRNHGTILAFELAGQEAGYGSHLSLEIRNKCQQNGLLVRPLGGVIYTMPPYCISSEELNSAYEKLLESI